jgi:DNA replication and repair protein RecF
MHLEELRVEQFRCLECFAAELPRGRILVSGDNARGKTSLLEAIFYLVTGRSFRTRTDQDCVPWGAPSGTLAAVRGRVRRARGDSCRLAVTLGAGVKSVRVDDRPLAHLADLWGNLHAVLFTPDDLQLVKGGPAERRRYLDVALSQISRDFLFNLQRYNLALRQRNALLKRTPRTDASLREELAPWDEQLIQYGLPILRARVDFLSALDGHAASLHGRILDPSPDAPGRALRMQYQSFLRAPLPESQDEARTRFRRLLQEGMNEDARRGMTAAGPHRDDFVVTLDGKPAHDFASQGQVRSCVLALRLAEVVEMEVRTGEAPLVLLDDLASELDPGRKERVLTLLEPRWQAFLTSTRASDFPPGDFFAATIELKG